MERFVLSVEMESLLMRHALQASAARLTACKESRRKLESGGLDWESGSNFFLLFSSRKNSQKIKQVKNFVIFAKIDKVTFVNFANLNLSCINSY